MSLESDDVGRGRAGGRINKGQSGTFRGLRGRQGFRLAPAPDRKHASEPSFSCELRLLMRECLSLTRFFALLALILFLPSTHRRSFRRQRAA